MTLVVSSTILAMGAASAAPASPSSTVAADEPPPSEDLDTACYAQAARDVTTTDPAEAKAQLTEAARGCRMS